MSSAKVYLSELTRVLRRLPLHQIEDVIEILREAREEGRQIFVMGNGGSAATASHFVCDLSKNVNRRDSRPFRVCGLTDSPTLLTAYANDEGYENIFLRRLSSLLEPGDVVIAFSTSGNSDNVTRAMEFARESGGRTIAFVGSDGGRLRSIAAITLHVPAERIEQLEDVHLVLAHMICLALGSSPEKRTGREA